MPGRLLATREGLVAAPPPLVAARRSWLKRAAAGLGAALLARPAAADPAHVTGYDPFVGEIMLFAGTYAPQNWAFCDGSLVSIQDNQALYVLIGTTYGGDGVTTFGLPDLRGRVPRHIGQLAGGSTYTLGQQGGVAQVTLITTQLPAHIHSLNSAASASSASPAGALPAPATGTDLNGEAVVVNMYAASTDGKLASANEVGSTGGGQPIALTPATLAVSYCIALNGQYPPRP